MTGSILPQALSAGSKDCVLALVAERVSSKGCALVSALGLPLWNLTGASFGGDEFPFDETNRVSTILATTGGQLVSFETSLFGNRNSIASGGHIVIFGECHTKVEAPTTTVSQMTVFGSTKLE